jgi:transposase-like protein
VPRHRRLRLAPDEERELRRWSRQAERSPRRARRARLILELYRGGTVRDVARRIGVHPETVVRWRRRFEVHRLEGLERDAPRVHVKGRAEPAVAYRILRTTWEAPPVGSTRWSTRSLARALRVNHMLVHRVWKSHGFLLPGPGAEAPSAAGRAAPEVVGVYLESPSAVAIRLAPAGEATDRPRPAGGAPVVPEISQSGGYAYGPRIRSSLGLLSLLDRAYESRGPPAGTPRWGSPELLVFLRSVVERSRGAGEVHIFFDRPLPVGSGRLDAWLSAHPGVRLHDPDPGEPWTLAIDRWLRSGPLRSAWEDRLVVLPTFDATIQRAFESAPVDRRGPVRTARGTGG